MNNYNYFFKNFGSVSQILLILLKTNSPFSGLFYINSKLDFNNNSLNPSKYLVSLNSITSIN